MLKPTSSSPSLTGLKPTYLSLSLSSLYIHIHLHVRVTSNPLCVYGDFFFPVLFLSLQQVLFFRFSSENSNIEEGENIHNTQMPKIFPLLDLYSDYHGHDSHLILLVVKGTRHCSIRFKCVEW